MRVPRRLTADQEAAISANDERILLVASAGAGKTEVLTRRILRHLQESPGQSFRILAVTFTVRAAQELQDRLKSSLASEAWRVDADTVHGFALNWLLRFGQSVRVFADTIVFSENADRLSLMSRALIELGEDDSRASLFLQRIDDARSNGERVQSGNEASDRLGSASIGDVYEAYLAQLEAANGIDFPEMLTRFTEAADSDPAFIRNFSSTYRHVLVDEGQDLSRAQSMVIDRITRSGVSLFVVADSRQSINAFAGASFKNAEDLVSERGASKRLGLSDNFRCSTRVLEAAERLAAHFETKPDKSLAVDGAPPGSVGVIACTDPANEAEAVVNWASTLMRDGLDPATLAPGEDPEVAPEQIAIVARARWLLDPVVTKLADSSVDVSIQGNSQAFVTPHGRLLLEGLALQANPTNPPSLRRLTDELRALGAPEPDDDISILENLEGSGRDDIQEIGRFIGAFQPDSAAPALEALEHAAREARWSQDLMTFRGFWSQYRASTKPAWRDLSSFLRFVVRAQQTMPSDPGVRLLTIHRVKGLEFKAVAIVGAYEGALPDYRAKSSTEIDEERRAFYVAVTRAQRDLLITYPKHTTDRYGRTHPQQPSRFILEAGLGDRHPSA